MDNMHWMEPLISNGKQDRETLGMIVYHTKLANVGIQSEVNSAVACTGPTRHPAVPCPTPAFGTNSDHNYQISPFYQHTACDGSLSDMLLPYQYDKTLDALLSVQEESVGQHELAPRAHNEPSRFINRPSHMVDASIIFNEELHIADGIVINDVQLAPAIPKPIHDAQIDLLPHPLPPRALTPAHTRRPPLRKGTLSYRENHIHSERQRRQDMTSLFNRLRSVLPNVQHDELKGDRCTLLGHVIDYVQELHDKVQSLGKVRAHLMHEEEGAKRNEEAVTFINNRNVNKKAILASIESVSVRSWGHMDIFITLNCPKQHDLWPSLLALLQDTLQLDVQNVALSSTPLFCVHSIYAKLVVRNDNEDVCCELKKILRDFVSRI